MKTIKMILGLTLFFTTIVAIMITPALTMAYFVHDYSRTLFLALLLPCSAFGFLIGFVLMTKFADTGIFDKLLD